MENQNLLKHISPKHIYQKVPVIEPKSHGIKEGMKAKIASTKVAIHSKFGKLKSKALPFLLGFKAGAIIPGK